MTAPAARAVLHAALQDALGEPNSPCAAHVADQLLDALCRDGWDILPARTEPDRTTPMTTPLAAPPLRHVIAEHSPLAGLQRWDGTFCHDCTTNSGTWTPWPCAQLSQTADITPIEGGWTITARTTQR